MVRVISAPPMSNRRSPLAALAVAVLLVTAAPVGAQTDDPSATTTTLLVIIDPIPTIPPVPEPTIPQGGSAVVVPPPAEVETPTTVASAVAPTPHPESAEAANPEDEPFPFVLDNRPRTGDSSTEELLDALRPLTAFGFSEEEAFTLGMGRFPILGLVTWSDDFHDPRYNPAPHYHQGNDLWANFGDPVRAPADGVAELTGEAVGGISVYVNTPDGTYYYMTHLQGFAPDLHNGDFVRQGQVVGFVGNTGNAAGGPPHVHFEIHPGGGGAVNPKPILDQWIADALAAVPSLIPSHRESNPRVLLSTGELRRFDVPVSATSERAAKSPLLWSASVSPAGTALRLAEVEAARMAMRVDWTGRAVQAQATAGARRQSQLRAVNLLSRLTPEILRPMLDAGVS
ncbi:MAG: peptidoglycan LD-endopeptidase LytH [Actinomycetota bacterium]|nr:peptidoglycan LD-endopeptidase LytH [Actinomycetota bacterium]